MRAHPDPMQLDPQQPRHSTLLELVQSLGDLELEERHVVELATQLVDSGRVVLTGNFAGRRFADLPTAS
jgi:hypothetical protein